MKREEEKLDRLDQLIHWVQVYAFEEPYSDQVWELTLNSSCCDLTLFSTLLEDQIQSLRRTFDAKGLAIIENATDEMLSFHAHCIIRLNNDKIRQLRRKTKEVPTDAFRRKVFKAWGKRCKKHGVVCPDSSPDAIMHKQRSMEAFAAYLQKVSKNGQSTKAHGLIFKKIGIQSYLH